MSVNFLVAEGVGDTGGVVGLVQLTHLVLSVFGTRETVSVDTHLQILLDVHLKPNNSSTQLLHASLFLTDSVGVFGAVVVYAVLQRLASGHRVSPEGFLVLLSPQTGKVGVLALEHCLKHVPTQYSIQNRSNCRVFEQMGEIVMVMKQSQL